LGIYHEHNDPVLAQLRAERRLVTIHAARPVENITAELTGFG
jgi:adenylate kinase family enzyme